MFEHSVVIKQWIIRSRKSVTFVTTSLESMEIVGLIEKWRDGIQILFSATKRGVEGIRFIVCAHTTSKIISEVMFLLIGVPVGRINKNS